MVYESGFTTRRTYSSRPVTTSYAVTYPSVQKMTRVYKTSYPIYSSYSIPTRIVSGTRVISSPVRVVTSPTRVISRIVHSPSPVRVVRTTTRVISSPERTSSYTYTTPSTYYSPTYLPSTYFTSTYVPTSYTTYTPSYHYNPTTVTRVYTRSVSPLPTVIRTSPVRVTPSYLKRLPPGYGARALTNYLNTEPFTTFTEETSRIRNRAQSLIRDLHTPVVRRARSCTPFPVTGYSYGPTSQLALDAYVARVTNPVRHIAKEVHNISYYPKPAAKYVDPELDPNRPSRKFSAPRPLEDSVDLESKEKQRLRQERLLTVNEEALDELQLEKKRAQKADEAMRRDKEKAAREEAAKKASEEENARAAEKAAEANRLIKEAHLAEEAAQREAAEAAARKAEEERLFQEACLAEEAVQRAAAEEAVQKAAAEEAAQKAAAEEAAAIKAAEDARTAEEAAQQAAAEAKAAEEAALRKAEEERIAEEQRLEEEQRLLQQELNRLAEIEKQAEEEREGELARQAAELADIARQEAEIAAKELQSIQKEGRDVVEPIVDEPNTPEDDIQEPSIELNVNDEMSISVKTESATGNNNVDDNSLDEDDE